MAGSNLNQREIPSKTPIKNRGARRRKTKPTRPLGGWLLPITLLFVIGMILFAMEDNNKTIDPTLIPPFEKVVEIPKETVIIEFAPQLIPVECRGTDYKYMERVSWNASIRVTPGGEFEYIHTNRLLIIPRFSAYSADNNQFQFDLESISCFASEDFSFNVTISGKTITDYIRLDIQNCKEVKDCNLRNEFIKRAG